MVDENSGELTERITKSHQNIQAARRAIQEIIVGQTTMVERLFLGLLADGHILLEGLPGLAKTLAVTTMAKVLRCEYKRVQFTPDLLPADLLGTSVYNPKDGSFTINKGPVFTNILLADEINRAPAKVQSALLEVMQEKQVTIAGQTFKAGNPYLVLATQNPIEHEGTYPLPEAQTDRFMLKVRVDYPTLEEERQIIARMATLAHKKEAQPVLSAEDILEARKIVNKIYVDDKITEYILRIIFATRQPQDYGLAIGPLLLYGASPRASIALQLCAKAHAFMEGRPFATPHDVKQIAHDVLRHRLRRSYEAEAEEISADAIIDQILETIPVP